MSNCSFRTFWISWAIESSKKLLAQLLKSLDGFSTIYLRCKQMYCFVSPPDTLFLKQLWKSKEVFNVSATESKVEQAGKVDNLHKCSENLYKNFYCKHLNINHDLNGITFYISERPSSSTHKTRANLTAVIWILKCICRNFLSQYHHKEAMVKMIEVTNYLQ